MSHSTGKEQTTQKQSTWLALKANSGTKKTTRGRKPKKSEE